MFGQIAIGTALVIVTTAIHAVFMVFAMMAYRALQAHAWRGGPHVQRMTMVGATILIMFSASIVEVSAWAGVYLQVGALSALESALYFSTVTYTTLGYGDILLDPEWRLLASLEAANGIIMFGWTTAVIVAVVQRAYFPSHSSGSQDA